MAHGCDRNTRYSCLKTITRRRKNKILVLREENGKWVEDENQVRLMVNTFYINLFTIEEPGCDWFQTNFTFPIIDTKLFEKMRQPIKDKEVQDAVFSVGPWRLRVRMAFLPVFTSKLGR
jgi:hypothetical protein